MCTPGAKVVVGDGRLTLAEAAGSYDLIVLDAFSSDSVPVHLLTREALAMYAAKLAPGGAIIFNISNRYMALDAVVGRSAAANGLLALHAADKPSATDFKERLSSAAIVAVVARREEHFGGIAASEPWRRAETQPASRTWTDDYSNIIDPIARKLGWR